MKDAQRLFKENLKRILIYLAKMDKKVAQRFFEKFFREIFNSIILSKVSGLLKASMKNVKRILLPSWQDKQEG